VLNVDEKNERSVILHAPDGWDKVQAQEARAYDDQKIYQLPVEITDWKFDGASEIHFNWEYDDGSADLLNLYEKGKQQQWDTTTRIDWTQELFEENRWVSPTRASRSSARRSGRR